MFEEPGDKPAEHFLNPADHAREKSDEFRMHAELAAVFEGCRKFDAQILPTLDPQVAREIQQAMGRLEKLKPVDNPILPPDCAVDAGALLSLCDARGLSTNDYHLYRRPGEVMIVRWLGGDEVQAFYDRLQAHFDAALEGYREDERQSHAWKQEPKVLAYLAALDAVQVRMAERYLREPIRAHNLYVLSTQTAAELNIAFLSDYLMGVPAADIVGAASAPALDATEEDLTWFFKLFSLRGVSLGIERMCFFIYLQRADNDW